MKRIVGSLLWFAVAQQLSWAAYSYYSTYTAGSNQFLRNGTLTDLTTPFGAGVTSSATNGTSLISSQPVPDGSHNYEAAMTLGIADSGVTYILYLEASNNALLGTSSATGTFYSVAITPALVNGNCSANVTASQLVGQTVSTMFTGTIPCHNGMTFHAAATANGWITMYANTVGANPVYIGAIQYGRSPIGMAGFGISGAPAGSTTDYIANLQVGPIDQIAPNPVSGANAYVQSNRVDIHAAGTTDDANGIGVGPFVLYRNGQAFAYNSTPDFTDTTVQPGTAYTYNLCAMDWHYNLSTSQPLPVTTLPAGAVEARQVGLRPTGTYWGGMGEQIDTLFGNLNYTFPLLSVQGRGWSVPLQLSYNSQNWVQDASGDNWHFGNDSGFGYGWNLQIGVLRRYSFLSGGSTDHWEFRDASGAVYRLNQNNNGIWSSSESVYLWYDSNAGILHFPNGMFWTFGSTSASGEQDPGDLYPTVIEDSNGNQITVTYDVGVGATWPNSSGRITGISDVRGVAYTFTYSIISQNRTYAPRYLTQITNNLSPGESFGFTYSSVTTLTSPINPSYRAEATVFLTGVANFVTGQTSFAYDPSGSGELSSVTFPYGGHFRWTYGNESYAANRITREVKTRYLQWDTTIGERVFNFSRDPGDSSRNLPLYRQLTDVNANATKTWYPNASGSAQSLIATYNESSTSPQTLYSQTNYTWAQDTTGNSYISRMAQTVDPSSATPVTKQSDQTVDPFGNVTQTKLYSFTDLVNPARIYNNTYLSSSAYTSQYIYNRLLTSTLTSGSSNWTLVTNAYDGAAPADAPGVTQHDTNYGTGFLYRGNATQSVSFASILQMAYDITGTTTGSSDGNANHAVNVTTGTGTNYAAPTAITAMNSLTTSYNWNAMLNPTSTTGPNHDTGASTYDAASRPISTSSPYGGVTNYTYSIAAPQVTATVNQVVNGQQVAGPWTQTYYDGLGRTVRVAKGNGSTTLTYADTVYDSCGCTPIGKAYKNSLPYTPGATPAWSIKTYDAIGRTLTSVAPDGSSTTTYSYAGNIVTITDPTGKWKQYVSDAFGQLVQVTEPSPNPAAEPNHVTSYTYDVLGHLAQVSMPRTINGQIVTQARTWTYDPATQWLSSAAQPESGATSYTYNADGTLATKTDAKNQRIQYTYDSYARLIQISRGTVVSGQFTENFTQRTTLAYDGTNSGFSSNTAGRVSQVNYSGPHGLQFAELYSYHAAGAVTAKRMSASGTALGANTANFDATYGYDSLGRATSVQYPFTQWQNGAVVTAGPQYSYGYDAMNRLNTMTGPNSQTLVSGVVYGTANQVLQLNASTFTETRTYNTNLQLIELVSGVNVHLKYNYSATQNNGRVLSQTDVVSGETVTYAYDTLNRLTQANGTGDPTGSWSQQFGYDGFGSLVQKSGSNAPTNSFLSADPTTNRLNSGGAQYDSNGNLTAYGTGSFAASYAYDIENRLSTAVPAPGGNQSLFGYDSSNQRVYQGTYNSSTQTYSNEQIYFYGVDGTKLACWSLTTAGSNVTLTATTTDIWFAGRLLTPEDRLQSRGKYFPYGEDRYSPNPANPANNQEKFAAYTRDSTTLLDYAYQRYYNNQLGRFHTPDPYGPSGNASAPQSWNRYTYTQNDPINASDPSGLNFWFTDPPDGGGKWQFIFGFGFQSQPPIGWIPFFPLFSIKPSTPTDATANNYARSLLKDKLSSFGDGHCAHILRKVLGDSTYQTDDLRNLASNTNFYNITNSSDAQLTASAVAGVGYSTRLDQIHGGDGSLAYTFTDSPLRNAPIVFSALALNMRSKAAQQDILLHEVLHSYLRRFTKLGSGNDADMFRIFASYGLQQNPYGGTDSITQWISTDCWYTPTGYDALTWWNHH